MAFTQRAVRLPAAIAAIVFLGAAWFAVRAQGLSPSSAGSLAELTAEVRQLRLTIQETGRGQTELHAIGAWLSAQQSRLALLNSRLDTIEVALNKAAAETQEQAKIQSNYQDQVSRGGVSLSADERNRVNENLRQGKAIVDRAQEQENAIRLRQQDLLAQIRSEEARWMDLVGRLEGMIKR